MWCLGSDLNHSRFLGFGDELGILERFQESRFHSRLGLSIELFVLWTSVTITYVTRPFT